MWKKAWWGMVGIEVASAMLSVSAGETTTVGAEPAPIRGTVKDWQGNAVAGACVMAGPWNDGAMIPRTRTLTDAAGKYEVSRSFSPTSIVGVGIVVIPSAGTWLSSRHGGIVDEKAHGRGKDWDFTLPKADVLLKLTLEDEAGQPVKGVVLLSQVRRTFGDAQNGEYEYGGPSDGKGFVSMGIDLNRENKPDSCTAQVTPVDANVVLSTNRFSMPVRPGAEVAAKIVLLRGAEIAGRVTDEEGQPLPGLRVAVQRARKKREETPSTIGYGQHSAVVDGTGSYVIRGISGGTHFVGVRDENRWNRTKPLLWMPPVERMTLTNGAAVTYDVRVKHAGILEGFVQTPAGNAVKAYVRVVPDGDGAEKQHWAGLSSSPERRTPYRVGPLAPGRYKLEVWLEDADIRANYIVPDIQVQIKPDETTRQDILLQAKEKKEGDPSAGHRIPS